MSKRHPTLSVPVQTQRRSADMDQQRGITLVELLTVIAVLGILLAGAIPSLGAMVDSATLSSQSNMFLSSLHLARSEAIKRNSRVTLCKSADGLACTEAGGWHQGWIVFQDANNNGAKDGGEAVIYQAQALPASFRLVGNLNVAKYVSFIATGGTKLATGAFQAGTLTLCRQSAPAGEARQIVINSAGRPRVQKAEVTVCV
ncbi:MAG: GspH/FimT family pseudopilin [Burkholderiaceae bacterium]